VTDDLPIVYIVDDDPSFLTFLQRLVSLLGFLSKAFTSAEEFLRTPLPDTPGCLVLDIRMPGLSGFDLQEELSRVGVSLPIIFITGHGDIPMSVRAMRAGAVSFLTKPLKNQDLLDAIREAIDLDQATKEWRTELANLRRQYESLTAREREVFALVVAGLLNKQIATELGASERTVKAHRGHVTAKMRASSLADLVRMADKLGIPLPDVKLPLAGDVAKDQ
jgi:FixJ family two-component response regulator